MESRKSKIIVKQAQVYWYQYPILTFNIKRYELMQCPTIYSIRTRECSTWCLRPVVISRQHHTIHPMLSNRLTSLTDLRNARLRVIAGSPIVPRFHTLHHSRHGIYSNIYLSSYIRSDIRHRRVAGKPSFLPPPGALRYRILIPFTKKKKFWINKK